LVILYYHQSKILELVCYSIATSFVVDRELLRERYNTGHRILSIRLYTYTRMKIGDFL
jgi:hypothetical protein